MKKDRALQNKTKIVCTIGPSVNSLEKIKALIHSGMNVARLNFSHGDHIGHLETIARLKQAREELHQPLAIMLDTKGPEIRIGRIEGDVLPIKEGEKLTLCSYEDYLAKKFPHAVPILPESVLSKLKVGMLVLFNDGYLAATVVKEGADSVSISMNQEGALKTGNGINVPDADLDLPAMTQKDLEDIKLACDQDLDFIAASFIQSPEHVLSIRKYIREQGGTDIQIIAKIESFQGITHFDAILQVADGIMVARGDLGVEVPLHQVPQLQKSMIRKSYMAGKPVLTATQMLESMIQHPRPTRAEVSDVANSIYDGTSGVMLSGETAIGAYPIEVVKVMRNIITEAEQDFHYENFLGNYSREKYNDIPSSITVSAVKTAYNSRAKAIFAFTTSGSTARLLSRLRPRAPILTLTSEKKLFHQLAFNWGVIPCYAKTCTDMAEARLLLTEFALENGYVEEGDLVILVAGSPFGIKGTTNMMVVESIGAVLVRGLPGFGIRKEARVKLIHSIKEIEEHDTKDKVLVMHRCDDSYLNILKEAAGIILDNHPEDTESENYALLIAKALSLPIITRATGALRLIKEAQGITMDPERGVIYNLPNLV